MLVTGDQFILHAIGDYVLQSFAPVPVRVIEDLPNKTLRYVEGFRQAALRNFSISVLRSNLPNFVASQLCLVMILAARQRRRSKPRNPMTRPTRNEIWPLMCPVPVPLNHIFGIICCSSWYQVVRIAARRVVAHVAKHKAIRDLSFYQGIGNSVASPSNPNPAPSSVKKPISASHFGAFP